MQRIFIGALSLLLATSLNAQTPWYLPGNTLTTPVTHYVGTSDNNALMLRTNAIQRLRLNATQSYTIGSFATQVKDGAVGLSPNNTLWFNGPGPFSRLHLHDGTSSVLTSPYRSWMDNGITFTTNNDQMYIGHKVEAGTDQTAAVIQFGDNDGPTAGPDVLKILFAAGYSGGTYGVGGLNGKELGRFHPQGFFGLGDFQLGGVQPTERLDLLTGRMRVRELMLPANQGASLTKVLVVDDTNPFSADYGVVKWRDVSTLIGNDCKWTLQGAAGSNSHISTAYAGNSGCPQQDRGVGIGVQAPKNKLSVFHDGSAAAGFSTNAVTLSTHRSDVNTGVGVHGTAFTTSSSVMNSNYGGTPNNPVGFPAIGTARTYTGVLGTSGAGAYSFGVEGFASIGNTTVDVAREMVGVAGTGKAANNSQRCIGVYGYAEGAQNGNNWAGWFDGLTFCPLGVWSASDGQFKHDVQPLTGASELIAALHPRTYQFNAEAYGFMGFEPGTHAGLMADEVAEVLPYIVKDALRPEQYNSDGELIAPEVSFKAINYQELIPILIASNKEQQERIARLEEMVAACCASGVKSRTTVEGNDLGLLDKNGDHRLMIQPNPFNERTSVSFIIEEAGRAQLIVNSSDGKDLTVLQDTTLPVGEHRYEWNTSAIEPGMYYLTLVVEGKPVVKKAVKVAR